MTRLRAAALAIALAPSAGCQFFFPLPLDSEIEAQPSNQAVRTVGKPFEEGEAFEFDVLVENVAVGKASLKVGKLCLADGKPVLPVDGSGRVGGLMSFLSSGDADTRALIDLDTSTSLEAKWDVEMDDKRTLAQLDYAPGRYRLHQRREERDKKTRNLYRRVELTTEQIPHDGHSLLGYLRRWDPKDDAPGFLYSTLGRHLVRIDVALTGREKIATPLGEKEAVRFDGVGVRVSEKTLEPLARSVPKPFTLWFSDDAQRTPLRLNVETDLAELTIDLTKATKNEVAKGDPKECDDRVDKAALARARAPRKPGEQTKQKPHPAFKPGKRKLKLPQDRAPRAPKPEPSTAPAAAPKTADDDDG